LNLVDLVDDKGLQQDEWSLTAPRFGKDGQLQVVGWSGKSGDKKRYVLKCGKCANDSELFGEGYFKSVAGSLNKGHVPCGCSSAPRWTKEQYAILCSRKAKNLGYTFLGFDGEWSGNNTKIKMSCDKHGEWGTGSVSTLVLKNNTCPRCAVDMSTKPDDVMIKSFFTSRAFHPDTKFWRSERKTVQNKKGYWFVDCPECGEIGEANSGDLQQGKRPCACSPMRQKQCYINLISDSFGVVALKFGVANNSFARVNRQDKVSSYKVTNHCIYEFTTKDSCKQAERDCKKELECGVVLKRDMPDGWSETTWPLNLDKIKQIYKKHGGIEVCHSP